MPSPLSVKNNFKSALLVCGGSALLFFLLIYFVYQAGQNSKKIVPEKYSESKFLHLNALVSKNHSDLLESQRKLAVDSDADLRNKRAELQKKIFNQVVAQKIVTKKTASAPAPAPAPAVQKPAATPQVNTQLKPVNTAPAPAPQPVITKQPRTTVS